MALTELRQNGADLDRLKHDRMRRFALEWCVDHCPKAAAIRAGYAKNSAAVTANKLLKNPIIKAFIGKMILDDAADAKPKVQSFLLDSDKWTKDKASAWIDKNKNYSVESLVALYKEIPLNDNAPKMMRKFYQGKIVKIDADNHIAWAKVTNDDLDRDTEILPVDSWGGRKGFYEQHPVLVSSHNYFDLKHQIGEAVEMDWKNMVFGFKYYVNEGNPEADWAWKLAEKGRAMYSVGFLPHKVYTGDAIPEEHREKEPRAVYPDNEMLEVSQVVVGSNRGALQCGFDAGNAEQLQYAFDLVKSFGQEIPDFDEVVKSEESAKEKFNCECIKCGHEMESEKHCKDLECPKCGGEMRRAERPGPGTRATGNQPAVPPVKEKISADSFILSPVQVKDAREFAEIYEMYKSGRVLSEKNAESVRDAISSLKETIAVLKRLLDLNNPNDEEGKTVDVTEEVRQFNERIKKLKEKE